MEDMRDTVATRRRRLREWIAERHGGVQASFVARTEINQGELSGLLKQKAFGEKKARAIERQAGMPAGYLDSPPTPGVSMPPAPYAVETTEDDRLESALLSLFRELSERRRFEIYARVMLAHQDEHPDAARAKVKAKS